MICYSKLFQRNRRNSHYFSFFSLSIHREVILETADDGYEIKEDYHRHSRILMLLNIRYIQDTSWSLHGNRDRGFLLQARSLYYQNLLLRVRKQIPQQFTIIRCFSLTLPEFAKVVIVPLQLFTPQRCSK